MTVPDWVQDSIFYQIFPDRFANGDPTNDPPNAQAWGTPPTLTGYQGGDLRGIMEKLDYLSDLGVNALYLNPIFLASSNHRYNTVDYFKIDTFLGNQADFKSLVDAVHQKGMHLILDGVFNHCGRGFFAFSDLLENQSESPYRDWFYIINFPIDAYTHGKAPDYMCWWNIKSLPKFNTNHLPVRRYLLDVAKYWIEQGIDGWRLDVPNEINDDEFWHEFRHVVKTANPDAYILGEIWDGSAHWVGETMFDGLMHYPYREIVFSYLRGTISPDDFFFKAVSWLKNYPSENASAMYLTLGTHDTQRLYTELGGNLDKVKQAFLLEFTFLGAPAIYYGDEIGLEGRKDPDCRRAFPWEPVNWKDELHAWVKTLAQLRTRLPELRRGEYLPITPKIELKHSAIFARKLDDACMVVVNPSSTAESTQVAVSELGCKSNCTVQDLLGTEDFVVENGILYLEIPAGSAMILKPSSY